MPAPTVSGNHMKTTLYILTLGLLTIFFSCGQSNEKKCTGVDESNVLQKSLSKKEKERIKRRKKFLEQRYADSLRFDKILQDALKIANQKINKDKFYKKYDIITNNISVSIEINFDYHFTKTEPHLIIRRGEPSGVDPSVVYIDIFYKSDDGFKKVISHKQFPMTYIRDTIMDINGDGLNDFVVNRYGSSGCCLKAFKNVYLLRKDKKTFSQNFEFINPTFSPGEKIIRGVCYGHPGETAMYKFRWNGEKIDTLEYVAYERNVKGKTGKIIITTREPYIGHEFKILKTLDSVPMEYRKIEGYDWFAGIGYE